MDGQDFDALVVFEILAELRHKDIHAPSGEITVALPDLAQSGVAIERFIEVQAEEPQQVGLFGREFVLSPPMLQGLASAVETVFADLELRRLVGFGR